MNAISSSGSVSRKAPLFRRQPGVRTDDTIYASRMRFPPYQIVVVFPQKWWLSPDFKAGGKIKPQAYGYCSENLNLSPSAVDPVKCAVSGWARSNFSRACPF
jgi:hypothetical protein